MQGGGPQDSGAVTSKAENRAGWGPEASRLSDVKSNPRIVNNKAISGPVVANTEQLELRSLSD